MACRIELSEGALRTLRKLDPQIIKRILAFLQDRVAKLGDPRSLGEALIGPTLGEFWKYRVGDWRLICKILDDRVLVYVLQIGNRREVHK